MQMIFQLPLISCNDSERDEGTEGQAQVRRQNTCNPHGTVFLAMAMSQQLPNVQHASLSR